MEFRAELTFQQPEADFHS